MRRWRRIDRLYVELPFARPGSFNAYLVAILVTALATWLRLLLEPWLEGVQFITYFPALILVALACGFRSGLLAAILSVLASWYFIIAPRGSFRIHDTENAVGLGLFLVTALMIVTIVGAMRLAVARYRALALSLRKRIDERTDELKSAQASLVQSQKMEAVGQLTGGIAHDFNNMLAIVIGNLDLALRRLAQGRGDVGRQIDHAMDGAQRAAALTQRLLVFARRQTLEPAVCDINRLLADLAVLLKRTLGELVRIETRPATALWPVSVDPAQMESAVINLAINARDAMGGAGALSIETANVVVGGDEGEDVRPGIAAGEYVRLSVGDTGIGMTPEIVARAIEPFFTTKEVGRGTGLGLSQVYGFVKQSGGHFEIVSAPAKGTTVSLYLPRHDGGAAAADEAEGGGAVPRALPGEVVLVVEDEDKVRRTSVAALAELGYGVREARTGVEALAVLASDPAIAIMFTDIVMPGLDGRALAVRALRQRPDLKILYTTGYAPDAPLLDDDPAMLRKPFKLDLLARRLRALLDGAA
jgi:signal transduction histidine kinase